MPGHWRFLMLVIFVFLFASVAIGGYKIATTPTEILGAGFQGLPKSEFPR